MLLHLAALAFLSLYTAVSVAMDGDVERSPANVAAQVTLGSSSFHSSNDESRTQRAGRPWTAAQREKFNNTITTRVKTEEMKSNWVNGRRQGKETLRRAGVAKCAASNTQGRPWTDAQREKFRTTIATRTVTEERRASWSKARKGIRRTEETKFLMAMRKLGTGQLPDGERKRTRRQGEGVRHPERQGRRMSDAAKKANSIAQKARWAKVRAYEQQQQSTSQASMRGDQV